MGPPLLAISHSDMLCSTGAVTAGAVVAAATVSARVCVLVVIWSINDIRYGISLICECVKVDSAGSGFDARVSNC